MLSEVPVEMLEVVDGLQLVGQAYPAHALLDSSPNDVPIDLACLGSNLNMQVSSGIQNNPLSNDQSSIFKTVSFNDVLLFVTGTLCSPYAILTRIRLQVKPGLLGKHFISPLFAVPTIHALYSMLLVGDSEF
ncbi:uncharacterized protein TNCV_4664311 [Trichonephila clavipes]|nr:uncharacterized protein TNCV_4664311 [Trichonephila clavipes]